MKNRQHKFLKEAYDIAMNEETDNKAENNKVKNPKSAIEDGLHGMQTGEVFDMVSTQVSGNMLKFVLSKHLFNILVNAVKNGKVKASALKDAIKDFDTKNIEDNSNIDWEHVEIDPAGTSVKCYLDGDSRKKFDEMMKELESGMKDIKKEVKEADKKLKDDVKKAKVKIDDKKLEDNALAVAAVIDNKDNKGKSGKELTKLVDDNIKKAEVQKKLQQAIAVAEKKKEDVSSKDADDKQQHKNADDIVKSIDTALTSKLGKDYKSSLLTGIYSKEELQKNVKKSKLGKVDFSTMKTDNILGLRIDFFGDESKDVISEVVDDKAGYKVREVKDDEKDEGIKKIWTSFKKVIENEVGKDNISKIVGYLKYWYGKNDDGNFDSLFVFAELKDIANESVVESMLNEDDEIIDSINRLGFNSNNRSLKDLVGHLGLLGGEKDDLVDYNKYDKLMSLFSKSDNYKSRDIAEMNIQKWLTAFMKASDDDPDSAAKKLLSMASTKEQKDVLAELGTALKPHTYQSFDDLGISTDGLVNKIANTTYFDDRGTYSVASSTGKAIRSAGAGMEFVKGDIPYKTIPKFDFDKMTKEIDDLNDLFKDGDISDEDMKKLSDSGAKIFNYTHWAVENKDSTDPEVQEKIKAIFKMKEQYKNVLDNNPIGYSVDSANRIVGLDPTDPDAKPKMNAVAAISNDEQTQEATKTWKEKLLGAAATQLGIARLIAKSTGIVLNKGKAFTDMIGTQAMKFKEDKNIIAQMYVTLTNGEGSKSKFDDTKFGVRFDLGDCKWHATCIDNRKMKFPEDKLLKAVFSSDSGKKFKEYCISRWKSIFKPEDEKKKLLTQMLINSDKLGLKKDKNTQHFADVLKQMNDKFDQIENAFK